MGKLKTMFGKFKGKAKSSKPAQKGKSPAADPSTEHKTDTENGLKEAMEDKMMQEPQIPDDILEDLDIESEETIAQETDLDSDPIMEVEDYEPALDGIEDVEPAIDGIEDVEQTEPGLILDTDDLFDGLDDEIAGELDIEIKDSPVADSQPAAVTPVPTPEPDKKQKNKKEPKVKKTKEPKAKKAKQPKAEKQKAKPSKIKTAPITTIGPDDHNIVMDKILRAGKKQKTVLFAGAGFNTMPLKIPVNVAIELSKKGKKCLLIDLDTKRNAIAAAFDLPAETAATNFTPHHYDTSFENLKIWPAQNFSPLMYVNINKIIETSFKKYNFILINTPCMDGHIDRTLIASSAATAITFTNTDAQVQRLNTLIASCKGKVISNIRVSK